MPSAAAPQTFRSVFFIPFALDPLGHRLLGPMDGWVAMGWDGFGWDGMGPIGPLETKRGSHSRVSPSKCIALLF